MLSAGPRLPVRSPSRPESYASARAGPQPSVICSAAGGLPAALRANPRPRPDATRSQFDVRGTLRKRRLAGLCPRPLLLPLPRRDSPVAELRAPRLAAPSRAEATASECASVVACPSLKVDLDLVEGQVVLIGRPQDLREVDEPGIIEERGHRHGRVSRSGLSRERLALTFQSGPIDHAQLVEAVGEGAACQRAEGG
jgi:hypothetical protein